jgi:uncharacterized protein YggE
MRNQVFLWVVLLGCLGVCQVTMGSCPSDNTIQASGQGTVSGQADIAIIRLGFNEKGATSQEVVGALAAKVNQAVIILVRNGYNSTSYAT